MKKIKDLPIPSTSLFVVFTIFEGEKERKELK
jgi:hypothetical protein